MPTIEQLHKLLTLDPQDTFVLYALAQAHAASGAHDAAIEHYDRCLGIDPNYCYAYFHKARSLEALGRIEKAADVLRTGIKASKHTGDSKALSEITGYLDQLSD